MNRQTTQKLSHAASHQVDRMATAASDALDHAHEVADRAVTSAQERAQDLARQAPGFMDLAFDRVRNLGERSSQIARATGALAVDKARLAADHTADRIRRDPLKSVLIAVATGAALAMIVSHVAHRRQSGR